MGRAADKAYQAAVEEIARVKAAGETSLRLFGDEFHALENLPPEIADLSGLQGLNLWRTQITNAGLEDLRGMAGLQSLSLSNTQITDTGLEHLRRMERMQSLSLSNTQITDVGLEHLRGMGGMQMLYLSGTQITDVGLEHLREMGGMQSLHLWDTQITDKGLAHLRGMLGLKRLDLSRTQITDAGLEHLRGMGGLQSLDLRGTQITDGGLTHLRGMGGLQSLDLRGTQITDGGLTHLRGMEGLRNLDLRGTRIRDLRMICDLKFDGIGNELTDNYGLHFADTPAAQLDPKLGELAEVDDHAQRTRETLAYLRGLPKWPAQLPWLVQHVTLDAILSAQTPLGWKFSPAHGAMVVYVEETPLDAFQSQLAAQVALRADDLKRKLGGANYGVRGDVALEVGRLLDICADDSRSLSGRAVDYWASLIALGTHLDSHDRGKLEGRDPLDLLSVEQRAALMTLLTIAGNFVRSFPQIKAMDEGAGSFLRREITLDMVAQMIEQALQAAFVAQQSAAVMQHVAGVAKGVGGQADKANSVTIRGLGNLITSASMVIGRPIVKLAGAAALGVAAGAGTHVGEKVADNYDLEKPAIAFIERISGIAPELIDSMPADEAAQVRAALRDAQDKIEAIRAAGDATRR